MTEALFTFRTGRPQKVLTRNGTMPDFPEDKVQPELPLFETPALKSFRSVASSEFLW